MIHRAHHLLLPFCNFSTQATSLKWRTQIQQNRLVCQISSLLLQRKHWIPILCPKPNLLSNLLNPSLFFQILTRTQTHPEISLEFFKWTQKALGFQPDLRSHCKMIQILIESDLPTPAKNLLDPVLLSHPASEVLDSMVQVCRSRDSSSSVLSFILEEYTCLHLVSQSLETFAKISVLECLPSVRSCNSMLEALQSSDEVSMAWCFYAAVLRLGFSPDSDTWSLLARLLCKEGKLEKAMNLLDLGLCGIKIYSFIIDCYSRKGDFASAITLLSDMNEMNLKPGFIAYSSVLDGGCRFGYDDVVDSILREMVVRELIPTVPYLDYDSVVQRFCELGRSYAAEMFFERAQDEHIALGNSTYMGMLRGLSREGRLKEAMRVYELILEKGVTLNPSCCKVFIEGICKGEPSMEADKVLKDVIRRGFIPWTMDPEFKVSATIHFPQKLTETQSISTETPEIFELWKGRNLKSKTETCPKPISFGRNFQFSTSPKPEMDLSKYMVAQCRKGRWEEATDLLNLALEKGILPDESFCSLLVEHFCADGLVEEAIELHGKMKRLGRGLDLKSYDMLLSRLVGDRRIDEAAQLFDYMRERNVVSSLSFSSMITVLCHEKEPRKAMKLHNEMLKLGLKPDEDIYRRLISGFA